MTCWTRDCKNIMSNTAVGIISPLPVGTKGLPSVCQSGRPSVRGSVSPSVSPSAKNMDHLITKRLLNLGAWMNRYQCVKYKRATFGSLTWWLRSQHNLEVKSCPAYNLVIWSLILQPFHRHDHHIETTCREQHLGRYVEGQGQSMTLQQNLVRPITLLFEVGCYTYLTEMITILRWCVTTLPIVWLCV